MARLILYCLLATDLYITLVVARPFPELILTTALALHGPFEAKPPSSSVVFSGVEMVNAGAPQQAHQARQHRPLDKSIAGGEAILCGLVLAAFAAIVCYIRVTRRRNMENKS